MSRMASLSELRDVQEISWPVLFLIILRLGDGTWKLDAGS